METLPPVRSSSFAPTSSSSARICAEMAGWVRNRFSAAREKLKFLDTSRNVSSWSKSIFLHPLPVMILRQKSIWSPWPQQQVRYIRLRYIRLRCNAGTKPTVRDTQTPPANSGLIVQSVGCAGSAETKAQECEVLRFIVHKK